MNANAMPTELLEARAEAQRKQLHNSVADLRSAIRDKMDVKKAARQYLGPAAGAAAIFGLLLGYTSAGIFTD